MSEKSSFEIATELFEMYADDVFRYARWMLGDESEAEDVTQQVFLKVFRAWPTYQGKSSVKTWLWTIVKRTITDEIRRKQRFRKWMSSENERIRSNALSTSDFEYSEVTIILSALPVDFRQVVLLRIVQDLSTREAATVLGWSDAMVRTTLHRALRKLRKMCVKSAQAIGGDTNE